MDLYDDFKYENAKTYLNLINKRKKQILKNNLKTIDFKDNLYEELKHTEQEIENLIKSTIKDYEDGNIILKDNEKDLLDCLKQNRFLKNSELAKILGYESRGI